MLGDPFVAPAKSTVLGALGNVLVCEAVRRQVGGRFIDHRKPEPIAFETHRQLLQKRPSIAADDIGSSIARYTRKGSALPPHPAERRPGRRVEGTSEEESGNRNQPKRI